MKKRVADVIFDTLADLGAEDCFMVVGGGAMYLDNALGRNKRINKIFNHHEQGSAMAADGYARLKGKPAIVCVTTGPGATNTITGILGAWQDSLPVVVVSGQVRIPTSMESTGLSLRYRGIQEAEIIPMVKSITKYAKQLKKPEEVQAEVIKAYNLAMEGRRGPVWLEVPLDVQNALVDVKPTVIEDLTKEIVDKNTVVNLYEELNKTKRPVILVGTGVENSGNTEAFRKFAKKLKLPVVAGSYASDILGGDCPYYYGLTGTIGTRAGNFILQNADLILSLGCSLSYKVTGFAQDQFAKNGKIIAVDIDEQEMSKPGVRVDQLINCDLSSFFAATQTIKGKIKVKKEWKDYCQKVKERFDIFENANKAKANGRVQSYKFWKDYYNLSPEGIISVLGNNTASSVKLQTGVKLTGQRIITNSNCGSMGEDLPIAIGAAVATKTEIICLTGDGCIMMNLQELQTIKHNKLPIKVVVFTNDGYNAIRQTCKNFFKGEIYGCTKDSGVDFPDFSKIADAFGFKYFRCNTNKDVEKSLKKLFSIKGNCLMEVKQQLDDPISPKVMSKTNPDGTFKTPALQEMYPFISEAETSELMICEKEKNK